MEGGIWLIVLYRDLDVSVGAVLNGLLDFIELQSGSCEGDLVALWFSW